MHVAPVRSVIWIRATVSRLQLGETIRRLHARRSRGWNKAVGSMGIFSTAEAGGFLKRHETSRQQEVMLPYFADRWDMPEGGSWRRTYQNFRSVLKHCTSADQ
jgi:hypothetical protein